MTECIPWDRGLLHSFSSICANFTGGPVGKSQFKFFQPSPRDDATVNMVANSKTCMVVHGNNAIGK